MTLRDVARRAGVAVSTASLALNGRPHVSAQLACRVHQAALELGYQPNGVARSLRTRRTQLVSLVVADINNPFFAAMARGAEEALRQSGYCLLICNTDEDALREERFLEVALHKKTDGVLLVPTGRQHPGLEALARQKCPVVLLDRRMPRMEADAVLSDNIGGAYIGTEFLLQEGHRRIGVITGHMMVSAIRERLAGHIKALRDYGIERDGQLIISGGHTREGGYHACKSLLDVERPPSAIFSTNNLMARGALLALRDLGRTCPEEVSLLGFDDFDEAALLTPPLTVVAQQPYEMGLAAGQLLLTRLEGEGRAQKRVRQIRLKTALVRRGSVTKYNNHHRGGESEIHVQHDETLASARRRQG